MTALFLYGPLTYDPLRLIVLGEEARAEPAKLPGFSVVQAADGAGATLIDGGEAPGLLIREASSAALSRLAYFQSVLGYQPQLMRNGFDMPVTVHVASQEAQPQTPWDLSSFANRWGATWCRAGAEIMGWYGRKDPTDFAPILSGVFRRAWSFAMNESGPAEGAPERRFDCVHHHRPYLNFFGVEEWDLRHTRHDGTMSGIMNRGALMVGNASVVLPYDPVRDCVLLTEQFRAPLAMAGEPNPWTWEPVAGLIDAGETAEEAAHREAMEEAGLKLERLEPAGRVYSSTGAVAECLYLFVGLCDLSEPPQDGGLAEEDEDIRSKRLTFAALMQGIDTQRYLDQPLVTCALWLARHRERLRA